VIGSSLRILFLGLGSLTLSWAAFLLLPAFSRSALTYEEAWFVDAFPSPRRMNSVSMAGGSRFSDELAQLVPIDPRGVRSLAVLLGRRVAISIEILPVFLVSLVTSLLAGILVRERLRFGSGYASPTISFLCKRLAEGAILIFFLLSFSPFPLPYWTFYPALGATFGGTFGYAANLPLRL
jgi:hypothetical protein